MRGSADTVSSGPMGARQVAGEEEEAVRKLRSALRNPHGTNVENRERLLSAWRSLRSAATSPDVQSKSRKRDRKRIRLESQAQKMKKENGDDTTIEGRDVNSHSVKSMREDDKMLHEAARLGDADRVRGLISQGSKVSSKDSSGYSALHWASLYGHVEVVRTLLRLGAGNGKRINRQNDAANTALHLACLGHHAQVAAILQIYKPDEHLVNSYDQTPISLGLRDLIDSVEKIQQLDDLQTQRANSQRHHLLSESLDWRLGRDGEYAASTIMMESSTSNEGPMSLQSDWDDYNREYAEFVERFTDKSGTEDGIGRRKGPLTNSSRVDPLPVDAIRFQDVPWPVTEINVLPGSHIPEDRIPGTGRLLLTELRLAGDSLRPLIQRERLRWHPDKFLQLFGCRLAAEDKNNILGGVQTVCQLLNSLADATEGRGD